MLTFDCKDMGIDCDYVAAAETKIEVLAMAKTHALEIHSELLKDLTAEQTDEKLESLIHENAEESTLNNDEVMESDEEAEEGEKGDENNVEIEEDDKDSPENEIEGNEDNKETETEINAENEEVEIDNNEDNKETETKIDAENEEVEIEIDVE